MQYKRRRSTPTIDAKNTTRRSYCGIDSVTPAQSKQNTIASTSTTQNSSLVSSNSSSEKSFNNRKRAIDFATTSATRIAATTSCKKPKGPPAVGLALLRQAEYDKRRGLSISDDSESNSSDEDYLPSKDSECDNYNSDCESEADDEIIVVGQQKQQSVNQNWNDVGQPKNLFSFV